MEWLVLVGLVSEIPSNNENQGPSVSRNATLKSEAAGAAISPLFVLIVPAHVGWVKPTTRIFEGSTSWLRRNQRSQVKATSSVP